MDFEHLMQNTKCDKLSTPKPTKKIRVNYGKIYYFKKDDSHFFVKIEKNI